MKVTLEQDIKAHKGVEVHSTLALTSAQGGDWGLRLRSGHFTLGRNPINNVQEIGWVPGPGWTRAEISPPTRIQSPDRPASSESLYRLSYPGPSYARDACAEASAVLVIAAGCNRI